HGRPADIDVFNRIGKGAPGFGDGFAEWIQVDHEQVDAVDTVFFQGIQVLGAVAARQQAAMYFGMQGFDSAVQDFGAAGMAGYFGYGKAGLGQELGGSAGGQQRHAALGQSLGEFNNTGFVGNRNKGSLNFHEDKV